MQALTADTATLNARLRGDVLLVPSPMPKGKPVVATPTGLDEATTRALAELYRAYHGRRDAGAVDHQIVSTGARFRRVALVCLGKSAKPSRDDLRAAAAAAARWASGHRIRHAVLAADGLRRVGGEDAAALWVEAARQAGFRFDRLRSRREDGVNDEPPHRLERLTIATASAPSARLRQSVARAVEIADAVDLARLLGHEPPNVLNPLTLARRCAAEARRVGLRCSVLDEKKLASLKMGALLAVGRGSATPPRLIVLEHRGARPSSPPVALVGKAVTQDTGGYSIKPWEGIPAMKYDKCGGMAVLAALIAAARLELAPRVVGVIAAAENMIDGRAFRPGDILTAMNGKTIEVISTDAEGRLMLADALCYARTFFRPRVLIDLATLTGACTVALGHHAAGLFSNNDELADRLFKLGQFTGDRVWRLPLWSQYRKQIQGADGDLRNSGGRGAGAITAAMFLKEFVDAQLPWAHLDIAGVAHTDKDGPLGPAGATGFGVRLLVEYLLGMGSSPSGRLGRY